MEQQEYLIRLSAIQQEAERLEQKMLVIEQQLQELVAIKRSLESLDGKKEGDEMLSNLGQGIFAKTKLKSKDLLVNIGKGVVVKKDLNSTICILDKQIERLIGGKAEIIARIEGLQTEMSWLVEKAEDRRNVKEEQEA